MGAELNIRRYADSLGKNKITEAWDNAVEESLYEDGHSYSGGIGMLGRGIAKWHSPPFEGDNAEDAAYDFISENHNKWNRAIAVPYVDNKGKLMWAIGGWCSS